MKPFYERSCFDLAIFDAQPSKFNKEYSSYFEIRQSSLLRRSLVRKSESILVYIPLGVAILTICSSGGDNIDNIATLKDNNT